MTVLKKASLVTWKTFCFLGNKIKTQEPDEDCTNYRYALGFVDTLLKMPYWKSWMKTIDI